MIRTKNMAEIQEFGELIGAATVANNKYSFAAPAAGFLKAVLVGFATMGTDGTGAPTQDVIVDIKKNGTSVFSGATKANFSHALQVGTANTPSYADNYGALTTNPVVCAKGDILRFDITQILNGTSPTQPLDLVIWVVFTRGPGWAPEATLFGKISEND